MPADRTIRLWSIAALCALAFALGGCSTQIADMPGVGLPIGAPERPKEAGGYLPVHDLPPGQSRPRSENTVVFDALGPLKTPIKTGAAGLPW
jgi:hypothetical protein